MLQNIEPLHYQVEAAEKALAALLTPPHKDVWGFFIGDKMGLGKTVEALTVADEVPKKERLVAVVCPAFLISKWRREIMEKSPANRKYRFVVESFSSLTDEATLRKFCSRKYDLIIFDEAHYFKSHKAQRTQAAVVAAKAGRFLLSLSGTWPPNDVGDTYTWLRMANNPLAAMSFESFVYRHAQFAQRTHFGLRHEGFRDSAEWRECFDPYFIGREIDDVTDAIPDGLRLFEVVDMPEKLAKEERQLFGELLAAAGHSAHDLDFILSNEDYFQRMLATVPDFSRLAEFRKRQGFTKIPAALNWLIEAREEKKKILVYCYHKEVAEKFAVECSKKKMPVRVVHGSNSDAAEREQILHAAQAENDIVLIVTIDAAREGVDLIGFDTTLFVEYDWRPWALEQAEGRTRRVGQKHPVRWVYMTFEKGIDKAMKKKVASKTKTIAAIKGVA